LSRKTLSRSRDDLHAFFFKQRLVEGDFVDRLADAPWETMMNFRAQDLGDPRVGRSKRNQRRACPAASHSTKSFSHETRSKAFWIFFYERLIVRACQILRVKSGSPAIGLIVTSGQSKTIHRIHQYRISSIFLLFDLDERWPTPA